MQPSAVGPWDPWGPVPVPWDSARARESSGKVTLDPATNRIKDG